MNPSTTATYYTLKPFPYDSFREITQRLGVHSAEVGARGMNFKGLSGDPLRSDGRDRTHRTCATGSRGPSAARVT